MTGRGVVNVAGGDGLLRYADSQRVHVMAYRNVCGGYGITVCCNV